MALGDVYPVQGGKLLVKRGQLGAHLLAQLFDEHRRIQGFTQLPIVLHAALGEVGGQVLIRVVPPVGAYDPDFLAPQRLP